MKSLATMIAGVLFGLGLAASSMMNPRTVLAFLTLHDMGLLLVLGVAVGVNLVVFQLVPRWRARPLFGEVFEKRAFVLNHSSVIGGVLFGLGWGICGVCPAPAFTGLGAGNVQMVVVLISILVGAGAHGLWVQLRDAQKEKV